LMIHKVHKFESNMVTNLCTALAVHLRSLVARRAMSPTTTRTPMTWQLVSLALNASLVTMFSAENVSLAVKCTVNRVVSVLLVEMDVQLALLVSLTLFLVQAHANVAAKLTHVVILVSMVSTVLTVKRNTTKLLTTNAVHLWNLVVNTTRKGALLGGMVGVYLLRQLSNVRLMNAARLLTKTTMDGYTLQLNQITDTVAVALILAMKTALNAHLLNAPVAHIVWLLIPTRSASLAKVCLKTVSLATLTRVPNAKTNSIGFLLPMVVLLTLVELPSKPALYLKKKNSAAVQLLVS